MGGKRSEVLEGILLGPQVLAMARRQVRELEHGRFLDPAEAESFARNVIAYLEATNALAPNRKKRSAP